MKYINANERFMPPQKLVVPKVDEVISKIVGKKVFTQDPNLLKLIVKYKAGKKDDDLRPDNFLENPNFIKELKQIYG